MGEYEWVGCRSEEEGPFICDDCVHEQGDGACGLCRDNENAYKLYRKVGGDENE